MTFKPHVIHQSTFDNLKQLMGKNFLLILKEYLRTAEAFMVQIQAANSNQDIEELARVAHPLKSSSAQIGAVAVRDIAGRIEDTARTKGDFGQFPEMVKELEQSFDELKVSLSSYIGNHK